MATHSDNEFRALFTDIGTIMEDASVVALIWDPADALTVKLRYERLLEAHGQIEDALRKIGTLLKSS
ncbi:hypothetical protein [Sphingorhabdus contaminans]|uniref:hypothetical protein n=1 Tax=Sphingorhabdus contaminans TaxID=1343899 RepID=UPI003D2C25DB